MRTRLEELGHELNKIVVMTAYPKGEVAGRIDDINHEIQKIAMHEAGVTATDLADEDQENSPRIQHFWTLVSFITARVYMQAANDLSSFEGLDR